MRLVVGGASKQMFRIIYCGGFVVFDISNLIINIINGNFWIAGIDGFCSILIAILLYLAIAQFRSSRFSNIIRENELAAKPPF